MKYVNQLEYRHIPYRTNVLNPNATEEQKQRNVALSGCGPSSVCMAVDVLTAESLSIEECIRISEECLANHMTGTDLSVLGPVIAKRYNLDYRQTNELDEAIECLRNGGQVIALVGVPEGQQIGLFTKGVHWMLLTATDGKEFTILDPSYTPEKFHIPEREGKVDDSHAPYLYCDIGILHSETTNYFNLLKYQLFSRKR